MLIYTVKNRMLWPYYMIFTGKTDDKPCHNPWSFTGHQLPHLVFPKQRHGVWMLVTGPHQGFHLTVCEYSMDNDNDIG